jgi:hypothetical protein
LSNLSNPDTAQSPPSRFGLLDTTTGHNKWGSSSPLILAG